MWKKPTSLEKRLFTSLGVGVRNPDFQSQRSASNRGGAQVAGVPQGLGECSVEIHSRAAPGTMPRLCQEMESTGSDWYAPEGLAAVTTRASDRTLA